MEKVANQVKDVDPLRRWRVPREVTTSKGTIVFRTMDNAVYARLKDGSIRRATPKVNGRVARRARARQRQLGVKNA